MKTNLFPRSGLEAFRFVVCAGHALFASAACVAQMQALPAGVPSPVGPDGKFTSAWKYTTKAYQEAAVTLVLAEANKVAIELKLPETTPIKPEDLEGAYIVPFGMAYVRHSIGNVTTRQYWYNVGQGNKFSGLTISRLDERCFEFRDKYQWPISRLDTNEAYQLAMNYLADAHMDITGLRKDCQVTIRISEFWNGIAPGEKSKKATFVPIYDVSWKSKNNTNENFGNVAYVNVFTPTKTLLQLSVDDPKYILRAPLVFTNLSELLSPTNSTAGAQTTNGNFGSIVTNQTARSNSPPANPSGNRDK